jgi:hypothetical protein
LRFSRYIHTVGLVEYIPCYSAPPVYCGLLPVIQLDSRKIPIEQNIEIHPGPALWYIYNLLVLVSLYIRIVLYTVSTLNSR